MSVTSCQCVKSHTNFVSAHCSPMRMRTRAVTRLLLLLPPASALRLLPLAIGPQPRVLHRGASTGNRIGRPPIVALGEKGEGWEEMLQEIESEKLYGLGSKEAELSQFASWLAKGKLNLFPAYQREYVWKPDKASRLIATVLCNRYVPPVVLHEKTKSCYDVVDGKQRLTSILGFYLNGSEETGAAASTRKLGRDGGILQAKLNKILPDFAVLTKLDETCEQWSHSSPQPCVPATLTARGAPSQLKRVH